MRFLRGVLGALLWLLGGLLGLVAVLLCVTVLLLPIGLPLLNLARKLMQRAVALLLPRAFSHPVDELGKSTTRTGRKAKDRLPSPDVDAGAAAERTKKATKRQRKKLAKALPG